MYHARVQKRPAITKSEGKRGWLLKVERETPLSRDIFLDSARRTKPSALFSFFCFDENSFGKRIESILLCGKYVTDI